MNPVRAIVFAIGTLALSLTARADVLFSNFGANDAYNGNTGWSLANGGPFGAHLEDAVSFTVTGGDYFFDSAEFGVGLLFGPNVLHITLHSDGGGVPGSTLELVTVVDQMQPLDTEPSEFNPPIFAAFSGNTILSEGEDYWLSISTDTSIDSWAAWNYNVTGDLGLRAHRTDGGPWIPATGDPRGVFRVNGTLVPAPASLALLWLGIGTVALRQRKD